MQLRFVTDCLIALDRQILDLSEGLRRRPPRSPAEAGRAAAEAEAEAAALAAMLRRALRKRARLLADPHFPAVDPATAGSRRAARPADGPGTPAHAGRDRRVIAEPTGRGSVGVALLAAPRQPLGMPAEVGIVGGEECPGPRLRLARRVAAPTGILAGRPEPVP